MEKDINALEWINGNDLSYDIWNKKYRYMDENHEEWLNRVSGSNSDTKQLIKDKKFLFGGRILANRGLEKYGIKTTLSNCYVITPPSDSIEGIFEAATKMARTFSYGGGVGIDISNLRPKGGLVHNAAKTTSGAVSFMDLYSHITALVCQEGRRGALMLSISCTHPDIIDFINLKSDLNVCTKANISVRMTDEFFQCVENDEDFYLYWRSDNKELSQIYLHNKCSEITTEYNKLYYIYDPAAILYVKKVKAKEVLELLALRNWEMGEPGILYWDRISNYNMLSNTDFKYAGVNPCAEEPLPAGGSCLLGSLNLSTFVKDSFTESAYIDVDDLIKSVKIAVRALNDVLLEGLALHPLQEQRESVADWRQIGLGITGLGDMLIRLGETYGSDSSLKIVDNVMKNIATTAVIESLEMAKEFGCYPKCEKEKLVESTFITNLDLPQNIKDEITKYGLYNSQLLTIAPTGTLSSLLSVSSGAEPNFAFKYIRKTISLNNEDTYYEVNVPLVEEYRTITDNTELPSCFISAEQIDFKNRIKMQSVLQKYIDASISSTLNLSEDVSVEHVYNIYLEGWKNGLKGCTIWRDNCKRAGILTKEQPKNEEDNKFVGDNDAEKRPKELEADFYTIKHKGIQYTIAVGMLRGRPYEIFAYENNIKVNNLPDHKGVITKIGKNHYSFSSEHVVIDNLVQAASRQEERWITLTTSSQLRHREPLKCIIKTLKKMDDTITSFPNALSRVLSKYLPKQKEKMKETCPECQGELVREGGCIQCKSCGWSKCG
jgi:ribonucleoside-diphosphate reductase alpha chain